MNCVCNGWRSKSPPHNPTVQFTHIMATKHQPITADEYVNHADDGTRSNHKDFRPRPHVSGDFCIRKFFYADTKLSASTRSVYESYTTVHTHPIRIRTSQRISQQSSRGKKTGSDIVTSTSSKTYGYERPRVSGYRTYTEISDMCGR